MGCVVPRREWELWLCEIGTAEVLQTARRGKMERNGAEDDEYVRRGAGERWNTANVRG